MNGPSSRPRLLLVLAAFFAVPIAFLGFIFLMAWHDRTSHAWVVISSDPVSHVAPTGATLVGSSGGHGIGEKSPSYEWLTFATKTPEAEVDRDLDAQLRAIGYAKMAPTAMNPGWTPWLPKTRQYRRGELTLRYFVDPTPFVVDKHRTVSPSEAPRVVVLTVENETAIDEAKRK